MRLPAFYKRSHTERLAILAERGALDVTAWTHLRNGGGLDMTLADKMSENVLATLGLPFSVALNFLVNGRDVLVPMATEEPSVVAAASNAAKMVRPSGGFRGEADRSIMTAQVQLDDVPDPRGAEARVLAKKGALLAAGNAAIPRMVERGGGCEDLDVRVLDEDLGVVVVHVHVDVGDAMGANTVDEVAEALAAPIQELTGGRIGLRILTNLPLRRLVRVRAFARDEDLGGADVADGIARASRFADLDVFRAVTHNKGFMNGVDSAALALGQDFRAIEAGAHAFASLSGKYRPLSRWQRAPGGLQGSAELPLAIGTVGACVTVNPTVRAALALAGAPSARDLAVVLASAGLASNLAALRALATEGIQRGHMRLHARKLEAAIAAEGAA
jgi:hydroxymethylglutaryl-CoA reductase